MDKNIRVIHRDGSATPVDIEKIRFVINWACEGKQVTPIALEAGLTTRLKDGITTKEIQANLINCALELCSPEEPDWRFVAGRLHVWNLWKDVTISRGYGYGVYSKTVKEKLQSGQYDERLKIYSLEDLENAGSWINTDNDLVYDYAGAVMLTGRYLLPDELPQEAFLTCALLLASEEEESERLYWAKKFYHAIADRKISLATPILANLRIPNGSLTSCFIVAMDDNLESIFDEISNTARISKNGGGVGVNLSRIRATGSTVMGKPNASGGVLPWIKLLNDTAIAVNQGGKRAGAVTTSLDIWHLDIPEFLEMQTENGDQRRKAYDVFPQVVVTDEFMRRVENKEDWTLVDPYEIKRALGFDLPALWGDDFDRAYGVIESELGNRIKLYKKVDARELFKHIMRSQIETGLPYIAFKDAINRANPNKHLGYIPATNLCVAPETKILTDNGHIAIADLAGEYVNVWNGLEFSEVLIRKTGENQQLLKVNFSNGESLDCTYYHKFHIQRNYKGDIDIVDAKDLKVGDKLIKYDLPVISSENDIDFPYAYNHAKFTVPLTGYTIESRLAWFAGLLDSDGTVATNGGNQSLQIGSIHKDFLLDVRLMLQTLGVDSKVVAGQPEGYRLLPDGNGGKKEYYCQSSYRLLVSSIGLYQLGRLGLKTNRLKWSLRQPQREASQFIRVESITFTGRFDDTYCFSEPKRHLGMFNGVLTGQCTESYSIVSPNHYAHCCNLVSINLATAEDEELKETCSLAVRLLDNTIDLTNPPIPEAKAHNNDFRTIGVGFMGLADWLAKNNLTYHNLIEISNLFEDLGYFCTRASVDLAIERGAYPAFAGSEWSKGLLIGAKPLEWFLDNSYDRARWVVLYYEVKNYGIRNSHITAIAPNTSSSMIQGCTASVLPCYSKFYYDKWSKGVVPIAPPFINDKFWYYQENKNINQSTVVDVITQIQQWIDTGISMELLFNLNEGVYFSEDPDRAISAKDVFDTLISAWKQGIKAIYYVRTVQKDNFKESESSCTSCAN